MTDHIYDVFSLAGYGAYNRGRYLAGEVFPQFVQVNGYRKGMPGAKALFDKPIAGQPMAARNKQISDGIALESLYDAKKGTQQAGCKKRERVAELRSRIPMLKYSQQHDAVDMNAESSGNSLITSDGSAASQKCPSNRSSQGVRVSRIPAVNASTSPAYADGATQNIGHECGKAGFDAYSEAWSTAEVQNRTLFEENFEQNALISTEKAGSFAPDGSLQYTSIFRKCLRVQDEIYDYCLSEGDFQDTARMESSETFDALASMMYTQHIATVIHQKARPESRTCEMSASDLRLDISTASRPEEHATTEKTYLNRVLSVFNSLAIKNRFDSDAVVLEQRAPQYGGCVSKAALLVYKRAAEVGQIVAPSTDSNISDEKPLAYVVETYQSIEWKHLAGEKSTAYELFRPFNAAEGRQSYAKSAVPYRAFKRQTKVADQNDAISFSDQQERVRPGLKSSSAARKEYLAWDVWEDRSRGLFRNPQIVARKTVRCANNLGRLGKSEAYRRAVNGKAK